MAPGAAFRYRVEKDNRTMARAASLTPLGVAALSLLVEEPMHPYEMYQLLVARHEDRLVKVRPGTLYHAVGRLEEQGLVEATGTEREGNRPERICIRGRPPARSRQRAQRRDSEPFRVTISDCR